MHILGEYFSSKIKYALIITENGPFILQKNKSLEMNPYGWDLESDLLYVD